MTNEMPEKILVKRDKHGNPEWHDNEKVMGYKGDYTVYVREASSKKGKL